MVPLSDIKTLYIDMDGVAINTIEAIVRMYDDDFSTYTDYKKIPWTEINTWEFTELGCASSEYINMYFNQKRFFDFVQPMDNFDEIVNRLKDRFSIKLCSMGYTPNLRRKELYIQEHYPFAEFIGVNFKSFPDKSHIDMSDGVIIDDSISNLQHSNAQLKILFGEDYPWNKGWTGFRCYNWYDVERSLKRWVK